MKKPIQRPNNPLIKHLRMTPDEFDGLYMTHLSKHDDGRYVWWGRVNRLRSSEFTFELTPAVYEYVKLLCDTQRLRWLERSLAEVGFKRSRTEIVEVVE